mmetsp:Transcript_17409/g.30638  ORF Transcript_17409/g.30638 Transcript_17409/m.30638 type:complete len:352 (-) Transcript_17409:18-1073(-)
MDESLEGNGIKNSRDNPQSRLNRFENDTQAKINRLEDSMNAEIVHRDDYNVKSEHEDEELSNVAIKNIAPPMMPPVPLSMQIAAIPDTADEVIKNVIKNAPPPTPMITPAPEAVSSPSSSAPQMDHDQSGSPNKGQPLMEVVINPPPRSMLPSSKPSDSMLDPPGETSVPILEATLVEEEPQIPMYDAVAVQVEGPRRWRKKHQKCLFWGIGLLLGVAVAVWVSLSLNSSTNSVESNGSLGFVPSSIQPSQSFPPSQIPSFSPTFQPTQTAAPTPIPSLHPTLRSSQSSVPSTSLQPSTSSSPIQIDSLSPSFKPSTSSPPSVYRTFLNWEQQGQDISGEVARDRFSLVPA